MDALVGSLIAARVRNETPRRRAIGLGLTGTAVMAFVAALSHWFVLYVLAGVLIGVSNAVSNASIGGVVIVRAGDENRGKVLAVLGAATSAAMVIALGLGGLGGSTIGSRPTLLLADGIASVVAVGVGLGIRRVAGSEVAGQARVVPVPQVLDDRGDQ